jgi:hypothetical protein
MTSVNDTRMGNAGYVALNEGANGLEVVVEVGHQYDGRVTLVRKADLAAALNEIEGFEVTYTPPRRNTYDEISDLPVGSVFAWDEDDDRAFAYLRLDSRRFKELGTGAIHELEVGFAWTKSDLDAQIVVLHNPEVSDDR